jgi:hypothetical protein
MRYKYRQILSHFHSHIGDSISSFFPWCIIYNIIFGPDYYFLPRSVFADIHVYKTQMNQIYHVLGITWEGTVQVTHTKWLDVAWFLACFHHQGQGRQGPLISARDGINGSKLGVQVLFSSVTKMFTPDLIRYPNLTY